MPQTLLNSELQKMHDGNPQTVLWSKIQLNTDDLECTYTFTQMSIYSTSKRFSVSLVNAWLLPLPKAKL